MESLFGEFGPVLVLGMILGLVELVKKLGAQGNKLVLISVVIGTGFRLLFEAAGIYPVIMPWVRVLVYGLLMGLAASA